VDRFTLVVDDFCPQINKDHPDWMTLEALMNRYPIKVTLFVPADHREIMVPHTLQYSNFSFCHLERMKRWADWANSLVGPRIEIAMHGLEHWNYENRNSCEFTDLDEYDTRNKIDKMLKIFQAIPRATKGFRPPGHGTNPSLYNILKENEFKYICLHAGEHRLKQDGLRIIESGKNYILTSHFGCLANKCLHKMAPDIATLLDIHEFEFVRIIDRV